MKEIFLICSCNEKYFNKANRYLTSIQRNSNIKNIMISIDFEVSLQLQKQFNKIKFIRLDSSNIKSLNFNFCIQHGGFLPAVIDFIKDDDIIIFTDMDIIMQRGFDEKELKFLECFNINEIGVNFNKRKDETLAEEATHLKTIDDINILKKTFPEMGFYICYNTGVVVAAKKSYEKLFNLYNENWFLIDNTFNHFAKQQWLLSYLINKHFKTKILPYTFHTHFCWNVGWRIKKGLSQKNGQYCIDNIPIIFCHHR